MFGFVFCVGSFSVTLDSYGVSFNRSTGLVARAREENIKKYLTKYGVNNVKSVKLVEPKYPKRSEARLCGRSLLRDFAEVVLDEEESSAKSYQERLRKYCGVDIELLTPTPPDLAARARAGNIKKYLTECGLNNVKSVKLVEPKFPKHSGARGCGDYDYMLRSFAESVLEGRRYLAESYQEDLVKYCGFDIKLLTTR